MLSRVFAGYITLAIMEAYVWCCLACGHANDPSRTSCEQCECPARASVLDITAAREAHPDLPGVQRLVGDEATDRFLPWELLLWMLGAVAFLLGFPSSIGGKRR
jgi:hypothetical protein